VCADPAATHAVPGGLAFGDVESVAERADQFRQFQGDIGRGTRSMAGICSKMELFDEFKQ
jgi:hypothetical protein